MVTYVESSIIDWYKNNCKKQALDEFDILFSQSKYEMDEWLEIITAFKNALEVCNNLKVLQYEVPAKPKKKHLTGNEPTRMPLPYWAQIIKYRATETLQERITKIDKILGPTESGVLGMVLESSTEIY